MASYDKHYSALGLKSGATPQEVRSAFRRIAKLYHPDQNSSPDAERKYRGARQAYELLKDKKSFTPPPRENKQNEQSKQNKQKTSGPVPPTPPPPRWQTAGQKPPGSAQTRQTTGGNFSNFAQPGGNPQQWAHATCCGNGWYSYDCDCDDVSDYGLDERIPFTVCKMPVIFLGSIIEAASVETLFRVLLYFMMMNAMLNRLGYSIAISSALTLFSLIGFTFFRYYHPYDLSDPEGAKANLYEKFRWSSVYILAAGFILIVLGSNSSIFSVKSWISVPFEMFIALFLLWAPKVFQKKHRDPFGR